MGIIMRIPFHPLKFTGWVVNLIKKWVETNIQPSKCQVKWLDLCTSMQLMFCFFGIPTPRNSTDAGYPCDWPWQVRVRDCVFFHSFLDGELTTLTAVGLLQVFSHETTINHWCFGTWLLFSPIVGMMIQSDELIFFRGVGIPWYKPIRSTIFGIGEILLVSYPKIKYCPRSLGNGSQMFGGVDHRCFRGEGRQQKLPQLIYYK